MTRGLGAAAARRNGPPPDPNSLNSAKRGAEWTRIPSNAREGKETPEWPDFVSEPTMEELAFWIELWKKPQSNFWIRDGMVHAVAMYCRTYISSMQPGGFVTEKTAAHRQADALLLTTPALLAAKVLIVDPIENTGDDAQTGTGTPATSIARANGGVRGRFTVVTPSADDIEEETDGPGASDD
jgi:hypothetical protein